MAGGRKGLPFARLILFAALTAMAAGAVAEESAGDLKALYRRPGHVPFPAENPYSDAKRDLGERLFFEPRLSGGNGMTCAGCHDPSSAFADTLASPVGEAGLPVGHRTPTLWNLAWAPRLFWDGRTGSLEEQALGPIGASKEMNQDLAALPAELAEDESYRTAFAGAFPDDPGVSLEAITKALATYERTLVAPLAPFDRWIEGDETALSPAARRGFALFNGKARCASCHEGWAFTDHAFHDIGLPAGGAGRGGVIGKPDLENAWKTPTLRQLGGRAPYMHDGSLPTLAAVVRHYVDGIVDRPTLSPDLERRLDLTEAEQADLVAFLESLDGEGGPALVAYGAPASESPEPGSAPRKAVEVVQRDKAFDLDRVRLVRGGSLVIHNEDTREHNVRIFAPELDYDSGLQEPGESVTVHFDAPGTFHAYCAIHPKMKMIVEVSP